MHEEVHSAKIEDKVGDENGDDAEECHESGGWRKRKGGTYTSAIAPEAVFKA